MRRCYQDGERNHILTGGGDLTEAYSGRERGEEIAGAGTPPGLAPLPVGGRNSPRGNPLYPGNYNLHNMPFAGMRFGSSPVTADPRNMM